MKNREKLYSVALTFTFLILISTVVSAGQEIPLTHDGYRLYNPEIYGNTVVWAGSYSESVFVHDLTTGEETVLDGAQAVSATISGNKVAWSDNNGVFVYDISTKDKIQLSTGGSDPKVYGNIVVWYEQIEGSNNPSYVVYMQDLSTNNPAQIITNESVYSLDIYGDKIVWADDRNGEYYNHSIYVYNISTSNETQVTTVNYGSISSLDIYGDRIVWSDYRNGEALGNVYMYDLSNQEETQITNNGEAVNPAIYGDRIVWQNYHDGDKSDIYMYDLSTSNETQISFSGLADEPAIYDDKIVWSDSRARTSDDLEKCDIYMYTISSDPIIKVGQGASTPEITQKFNDSYYRNGGLDVLGKPTTEVYEAGALGFEVQEFPGVSGIPGGVIMYNPNDGFAYYIHGAIWEKYRSLKDEDKAKFGHVASDEGVAAIQSEKTTGNYTKFETGTIHWISDRTGENVGNAYRGQSFVTYGDLDKLYTEMGGTYSDLGFPIMDQEENDGFGYCKFEGGDIDWDDASSKYIVKLNNAVPEWTYDDFSFVQITDIHVGEIDLEHPYVSVPAQANLKNIITEINNMYPKPEFILVTGDLVWYDDESADDSGHTGNFEKFNNIVKTSTIGTKYYVPGNHDRRLDPTGTLISQYLTGYNRIISTPTNQPYRVEFDYRGYKFIGFDSEGDYNTTVGADAKISYKNYYGLWLPYIDKKFYDNTPESWGLSETQTNYLNGLPASQPKIIFMHHPAIQKTGDNDAPIANSIDSPVDPTEGDYGGNDGCIRWQRPEFINYCKANNVQLVVTGHSHVDEILSASGEIRDQTSTEYPIFIQTDASVNDHGHYRIFKVKDGLVTSEAVAAPDNSFLGGFLECPANLRVYDSQNRYTGLNSSGEVEIGIPNSFYEGRSNDTEPISISVYDVNNEYRFEVVANLTEEQKNSPEIETFNLTVEQYINENTNTTVTYRNVPLTENTIATLAANLTTTSYVMEIDSNGDGVKDETIEPNSVNINGVETIVGSVSPASITNLQSINGTNWINWTWINPIDTNFDHTEIYLDGIFQSNISTEYFNATGLQSETSYTISTRTVDTSGNVNETWVNSTATTGKAPIEPIIVEAGSGQMVEEGTTVNFEGSVTASGSHTYSYHWDFGDGSVEDGSLTTSHTYADDGDYTADLTVTDEEGNFGNDTVLVTVNNAIPVVDSGSDLKVTAGDPVSFTGTFSDSGWLDTHTAEWNFGEGTVEVGSVSEENESPESTGTVSGSFSYFDAGEYTVTMNVTDDDNGIGQDQATVTVRPIAATVNFDPDTLNLGSGGSWITAYIELPQGYSASNVDVSSILLNGVVPAISDSKYSFVTNENEYLTDLDTDGISERMFKFNREEVEGILKAGDQVTVTLTGTVEYNNGISSGMASFEGSDVIKVTESKNKKG